MFAIIGATGKIGYSTASALRKAGAPVRAILRNGAKASRLSTEGCEVALADLHDPLALASALKSADAVQVILPPPLQAADAAGDMRRIIDSLAKALEQARPNRVLVISDYGAHLGEGFGMPSLFHELEQRLRQVPIPLLFLRSAEHMEGWAPLIPLARETGILPSFHQPLDRPIALVSAREVGLMAADLLQRPSWEPGIQVLHAEGPRRYSAADVATALSQLLGHPITAQAVPRSQWRETWQRAVSPSLTDLLVDLYDTHNRGGLIDVEPQGEVIHGVVKLVDALRPFVPLR